MRHLLPVLLLALACAPKPKPPPVLSVPQTTAITAHGLSGPVESVRDEQGIVHIYAASLKDAMWAQGFLMAQDRWVQMDLARRLAEGRLAELLGDLDPSLIDQDIQMRMHHMEKTASESLDQLRASTDAKDKVLVAMLDQFAAGVNQYVTGLQSETYKVTDSVSLLYDATKAKPWTAVDSLAVGRLLSFEQSYTADGDIMRSAIEAAAQTQFDQSQDAAKLARAGFGLDLLDLSPIDHTYTLPSGWTSSLSALTPAANQGALALYLADRPTILGVGLDRVRAPARGSNNWVVGPQLAKNGHTLLASDPHLSLGNPATWWLVHIVARDEAQPTGVMGIAIPGVPGVALGFNQHIAWGATDSYLDCTDVYREQVVTCEGTSNPCVVFKGQQVPLVPRVENIDVGSFGSVTKTVPITFYDVPHHGPIIPRVTTAHGVEPLGSSEMSVVYTGYAVTQEVRAILGLNTASSVDEAVAALHRDFTFGGFNWVIGDDKGHYGWTEIIRVPRRPAGAIPWKVMPGDGSAEWTTDLDPKYIPHAYDPASGFIATANNDPIGVTESNDPLGAAPVIDGVPLYIGADFDPGTRVGRVTKRLQADSADHKLTLDDMSSIQADAISEVAPLLTPTLLATAQALQEESLTPGSHAELAGIIASTPVATMALVASAATVVSNWTYDTPSGVEEEMPTPQQKMDAQATLIYNVWRSHFEKLALSDELTALGVQVGSDNALKVLLKATNSPEKLSVGREPNGDSILFDKLDTPETETKLQISAQALIDALAWISMQVGTSPGAWAWGKVHTLTLASLLPIDALNVPPSSDPKYPHGFPRHGDDGTVDVGHHGFSLTDFSYGEGPTQRFVVELTPNGPIARNALPGGQVFDPQSPHYADLMELWRRNKTFDVAYQEADVAAAAKRELSAHGTGRVHFAP